MVAKSITRKKIPEVLKEELLNLLRKNDAVKEQEFNIQNIIDQREPTDIIKHY